MNEREYLRLKGLAEAEFRRKIEAIETVWRMTGNNAAKSGAKNESGNVAKGSLQQAIRYAIDLLSGEFTVRDVEDKMRSSDPAFATKIKRASLSAALKRIADDEKKIQLTETGKGKRPSKYKKVL